MSADPSGSCWPVSANIGEFVGWILGFSTCPNRVAVVADPTFGRPFEHPECNARAQRPGKPRQPTGVRWTLALSDAGHAPRRGVGVTDPRERRRAGRMQSGSISGALSSRHMEDTYPDAPSAARRQRRTRLSSRGMSPSVRRDLESATNATRSARSERSHSQHQLRSQTSALCIEPQCAVPR